MSRPVKLFCYRLGRDLHKDVDEIMSWPLYKIHEYMAFYMSETEKFKTDYKEETMTPEERQNAIAKALGI